MATILCDRTASGDWQLYCEKCLKSLDIIGSKERVDIGLDYAPVLCFDCDGGADEVPSCLLSYTFPYTLVIDGKSIPVDPFGKLRSIFGRTEKLKNTLKRVFRQDYTKKTPKTPDGHPEGPGKLLERVARRLLGS